MSNNNHNVPKLEGTNAVQDYLNGMSTKKIAEKYGVSRTAVSNYLKKQGVEIVQKYVKHSKYTFDEHWLDEMDSPEKWYFLGFMYADGSVGISGGNYRVRIKLKADETEKELLEKFKSLLKSDREITYEEYFNKSYESVEKTYLFSLGGKYFCERLIELGCIPNKSLTLEPPKDIPEKFEKDFLRGYFDGDGSILLREEGTLANIRILGTEKVAKFIDGVITKHTGIVPNTQARKGRVNQWQVDIAQQRDVKTFAEWLYSDANLYLRRKKDNFDKFIATRDFSIETHWEKSERLEENLDSIIQRYLNGESQEKIAESFRCARNTIYRILKKHNIKR